MRVGIIQSNYIPWRGYFDFIDEVDLFIFHDDLQYTKNDWRNRNKIKTDQGTIWLTVSVYNKSSSQLICDTAIDYSHGWNQKHINQLQQWYIKAPYFSEYRNEVFDILKHRFSTISDLNSTLCKWIMGKLDMKTPILLSSEFQPQGKKTERVMDILKKVGATTYLSGPAAKGYLEEDKFKHAGIDLEYKVYEYPEYPQLYGKFEPQVSVLDLIFNCGKESRKYLKSLKPNEKVIS